MNRIAFCSIDALQDGLDTFQPTHLVSIWSPRYPVRDIEGPLHMHIVMDDVEYRTASNRRQVFPDRGHVDQILEFSRDASRLLIHCVAGLSRSPSFAIIAAVQAGHTPATACAEVKRLAPYAQPNRLVLAAAADVMENEGLLTAALDTFAYTRGHGLPQGERAGLTELLLNGNAEPRP